MRVTIKKNRSTGEWVVQVWASRGELLGEYFTDDHQDAKDTAADMLSRAEEAAAELADALLR